MRPITSKSLTASLLAIAAAISLTGELNAQIRYRLVLPEVADSSINRVSDLGNEINENGETLLNRITTFAVWKDGAITHIASAASEHPGTPSLIDAASINRFQQVVGSKTYRVASDEGTVSDTFPFYWDPSNGLVDLDDLGSRNASGAGTTRLFGINEQGLSLGTTLAFEGASALGVAGFTWSFEAGRVDIPALASWEGYSVTQPNGLNDTGLVAGTYRDFTGSADVYVEQAFVFTPEEGSIAMSELAPEFFNSIHSSARDVNNLSTIVGERDGQAYAFNLETLQGNVIPAPAGEYRAAKAHALNDEGLVVGSVESSRDGATQVSPFLWSEALGSVDLLPQIGSDLKRLLSEEGIDPASARISPKAINGKGQISAALETGSSFSREVLILPSVDLQWHAIEQTIRNGVRGVLYTHDLQREEGLIPASALGYAIGFECSPDMRQWKDIGHEGSQIAMDQDESSIQLFVPFGDCVFVRPKLVAASN